MQNFRVPSDPRPAWLVRCWTCPAYLLLTLSYLLFQIFFSDALVGSASRARRKDSTAPSCHFGFALQARRPDSAARSCRFGFASQARHLDSAAPLWRSSFTSRAWCQRLSSAFGFSSWAWRPSVHGSGKRKSWATFLIIFLQLFIVFFPDEDIHANSTLFFSLNLLFAFFAHNLIFWHVFFHLGSCFAFSSCWYLFCVWRQIRCT